MEAYNVGMAEDTHHEGNPHCGRDTSEGLQPVKVSHHSSNTEKLRGTLSRKQRAAAKNHQPHNSNILCQPSPHQKDWEGLHVIRG